MSSLGPLPVDAPVHIAGHRGMVGSAIWRLLERRGHRALIGRGSDQLDLRDRDAVFSFYDAVRPEYVFLAAARVGGILANASQPAEFLSDNLRIQVNIIDAAHAFDVKRLLFLGSSCIYPRDAPQPISEEQLLTGPLESTNDAYAIAKIAGIMHVQAMRREHGCSFISAMPTNLYGPNDNYDAETSHVLAAMIGKFHDAKLREPSVTLWGTGTPRREFLHVDDLAEACVLLLETYDESIPVNVGAGVDLTIRQLAALVADVVGYRGSIVWDESKPDGTPRKLLDSTRLRSLGWQPRIPLRQGVEQAYADFVRALSHEDTEQRLSENPHAADLSA